MPITSKVFLRSTIALLVVGLLVLLAIIAAAFWLGFKTQGSYNDVNAARNLRAGAVDLRSSMQDAETGQRGFLITGRNEYLQPYSAATAVIPRQMQRLNTLATADPEVARSWADAQAAAIGKLDELAKSIALKKAGDSAQAVAMVDTDQGKVLMDRLRQDLDTIIDVAEGRLTKAGNDQRGYSTALGFVAVFGAAAILLVFAAGAWTVLRYTRELAAARDEVALLNADLEQRVNDRTADLLEANEEIQRFAYIVTHDLRAPLVNIMGFTAELETSVEEIRKYLKTLGAPGQDLAAAEAHKATDADLPEAIGFIRSSTRKMDGLINAILKLAREGGRVLRPEPVQLGELLEAAIGAIRHQMTDAAGEVALDLKAPVIIADKLALEQVFGNLLDNAVKYRSSVRPLRISVRAREMSNNRVEVEIADNGRGIDPKDRERVFELFRRSGAPDQPGEGIGLAYVRTVVRNLGGDIRMKSALDQGTTFTVSLPRAFKPVRGTKST